MATSNSKQPTFNKASLNPDDFGPSQFDAASGVIVSRDFVPYRFPSQDEKRGSYNVYAKIGILPDEDSGYEHKVFYEYQRVCSLRSFMPSPDGETLAGGISFQDYQDMAENPAKASFNRETEEDEYAGQYLIGPGKRLPPSDHAQFLTSLSKLIADASADELAKHGFKGMTDKADCIVGLHLRFDRMKQDDKMGNQRPKTPKEGEETRGEWKVLCPTELMEPVSGNSGAKESTTSSKSASKKSSTKESDSDDFREKIEGVLKGVIKSLGDSAVKKKVSANLLNSFDNDTDRKAALDVFNDNKWMNDDERPWKFEDGEFSIK